MRKKELAQSLLLATILTVGFAAVWGVVGMWLAEVAAYSLGGMALGEDLMFLSDGTPVVAIIDGPDRQYRSLDGKDLPTPDTEESMLVPVELPLRADTAIDQENYPCSFGDGRMPGIYWYFRFDGRADGWGYFIGYDSETRACVGYLGMAGFRQAALPAEELIPFGGPVWGLKSRLLSTQGMHDPTAHPRGRYTARAPRGSVSFWHVFVHARDGKLYRADLRKRTFQVAFDRSPVLSAYLATGVSDGPHGTPRQPVIRTAEAVFLLDESGSIRKRFPIPAALSDRDIRFAETSKSEALMLWESPRDAMTPNNDYRICHVEYSGKCRQIVATLASGNSARAAQLAGLAIPSPLGLSLTVATYRPKDLLDEKLAATYPEALGRTLREFVPALAIAQFLALLFALLCYRRQLRYGTSRIERIIWPLFVLVLGVPGWIGYRFGRSWPVLAECEDCGIAVPRDRVECVRCASAFPNPALEGTEVFA
jgi:hypothetical protein